MDRKQATITFAFGGLALVFALFFVALGAISRIPEKPSHPTRATVTSVTYDAANRFSFYARAEFRAADGRTGTARFPSVDFSCHVGDIVDAEEVGINLRLRGGACRHVPPSPWASVSTEPARH